MRYEIWNTVDIRDSETKHGVALARHPGDARRIAALLNAADGMTTESIEDTLRDGGLGRVVAERERLRAALAGLAFFIDFTPSEENVSDLADRLDTPDTAELLEAFEAVSAALGLRIRNEPPHL